MAALQFVEYQEGSVGVGGEFSYSDCFASEDRFGIARGMRPSP